MKNIKITLSYDGTNYFGWQMTKFGPSIEEELQKALFTLFKTRFSIQAASRTDKKVHAQKQIANFFLDKEMDLEFLKYKLNCLLSKDIRILNLEIVNENFHPTIDCIKKHYKYFICQDSYQFPHKRLYSWHVHTPLDIDKMNEGSKIFLGEHNFLAFSNRPEKNPVRKIDSINIETKNNQVIINIIGNSFLYKMVRNMVGSLVELGKNKISIDILKTMLNTHSRKKPFITAPAHGLFLYDIFYE